MAERYDAIIIGAGVIGAAVALSMSRQGRRTLNIDKLPAAGYGSTSNSCAIIRVHYSTLDGIALAYESYFHWKQWADYLGVEDERGHSIFHDVGILVMKTGQNDFMQGMCAQMDKLAVPYEHWDQARIKARLPLYDLRRYGPARLPDDEGFAMPVGGEVEGGVFFPTAGYISDPQLATHNLQRAAEAAGATFLFNKTVAEIPQSGRRVQGVVLDDGTRIEAPVVVNVAGPHSQVINAMAGAEADMKIRTRALRQEVVHVPAPAGFEAAEGGIVVGDSDVSVYIRPETGNHILIGSEDPECDPREWVDPDDFNREFSEQWTIQAQRYAQRVPSLGIPGQARGVVDLYDVSDDWIPIYDRSAIDGYYMAIGSSGNQFKNAPVAGQMMAALIDYCEGGGDHDAAPLQFPLPRIGHTIDMGFCSRLREIHAGSSFSVLG